LPTPIRVLHIITQLDVGGAEHQLLTLCRHLPRDRFACRVATLVAGGELVPRFVEAGVPVDALDRGSTGGRRGQLLAIARAIRAWRPHVVQTWLSKANHVGRLAALLAGRPPLVACFRDQGFNAGPGDTFLDLCLEPLTARVLHNSATGRDSYLRRLRLARPSRQALLPNGIDAGRYRPDPTARAALRAERGLAADDPVVVMVARLHPVKDPALFLALARRVRRELPAARFWLVGGGPLAADLAGDLAADPDPGVWLAGERDDVPRLLAAADLAVLTSRSEGLSNTILEAMSVGLPVVVTRVGGNGELVVEGETGHLVADRDAAALAAPVIALLRDPARRRAFGQAGRARVVAEFSIERMVQRAANCYEECARRP